MNARERFPIGREDVHVRYTIDPGVWKDMCDEIDELTEANERLRAQLVDGQNPGKVSLR